MKTDDLIASLAADNAWHPRPVWFGVLAALMAALPLSGSLFMMTLGMRPDAAASMHNPFFDLKFIVTLALAGTAAAISLYLSRPEALLKKKIWLLAIPLGLLGIGIAADLTVQPRSGWLTRLVGANAKLCLVAVPLLSLPMLAAALLTLRRGATSRPALTGAFAGLMSAGFAGAFYASHCPDDSPLFVAMWYSIASIIVAAIGAFAGARVLKF
ncbi:MAG TPA: DUF1109 domain-containing protein [Afipia sp.]